MRKIKKIRLTLKNFTVEIKISFFILLFISVIFGFFPLFGITFIFVTLHELCHLLVALAFGGRAEELTVYPIGESAVIKDFDDINLFKRLVVLLSGPLFNIVIGIIFYNYTVGKINIVLGVFNLLPVYPLDGGKILHYVTAYFTGTLRSSKYMGIIACCTGVVLLLSGIVQMALYGYNLSMLAVGIYILRLNRFKYINVTYSFYRALTKKRKCRVLPVRSIVVSPKTDTKTIIYRLGWDYYLNVMIRGENGEIFTISEDKFIGFIMKKGINCEISNIFLENSA